MNARRIPRPRPRRARPCSCRCAGPRAAFAAITRPSRPERCSASCRAECTPAIGFEGLAVGGLAVGESEEERNRVLDGLLPQMPVRKPRYLMGVGRPEDIV